MNKPSSNLFKFCFLFLVLVSLGIGIYKGVVYFKDRDKIKGLEAYNAYIDMLKNDTYGGKTPEETLKLFLSALKEGDVNKASLYFALDDHGSRQKWLDRLTQIKEKNLLPTMVHDIETLAKPVKSSVPETFFYSIYNSNGVVAVSIVMDFNGKIWKIESF